MYQQIRRISPFFVLTFLCGSVFAQSRTKLDSIKGEIGFFVDSGDTLRIGYLETLFEHARLLRNDKQWKASRSAYLNAFTSAYRSNFQYDTALFWSIYEYLEPVAELYNAIDIEAPELYDSLSS